MIITKAKNLIVIVMWVKECLCMCVCQLYAKGATWIVYSDGGRGLQPHPLQRSRADRKGPRTWASNPHVVRKRETRQPITRKPCSSSEDRRGPQVEPPQPWSKGAREPEGTGHGLAGRCPPGMAERRTKSPTCPRTTPPPGGEISPLLVDSGDRPRSPAGPQILPESKPFCRAMLHQLSHLCIYSRRWESKTVQSSKIHPTPATFCVTCWNQADSFISQGQKRERHRMNFYLHVIRL